MPHAPCTILHPAHACTQEQKKHRLIVRNLAFQCTAEDLQQAFAAYGTVQEVRVPAAADGKARGFGFILLDSPEAAQSAMEGLNGKMVKGRLVAIDYALPKGTFDRLTAQEAAPAAHVAPAAAPLVPVEEEEAEIMDIFSDEEDDGVQWVIDPNEDAALEEGEEGDSSSFSSDDGEDDEDAVDGVEAAPAKKPFPTIPGPPVAVTAAVVKALVEPAKPAAKKAAPAATKEAPTTTTPTTPTVTWAADVSEGCTLFVRNLPFHLEEEAFADIFHPFGALRYARITKDKVTGMSKGSAFVCYLERAGAEACLEAYDEAARDRDFTTEANTTPLGEKGDAAKAEARAGKGAGKKKGGPNSAAPTHHAVKRSVMVQEPANVAYDSPFMLDGRFLDVTVAISKEQSKEINHSSSLARRATDKRRLYLLREGMSWGPALSSLRCAWLVLCDLLANPLVRTPLPPQASSFPTPRRPSP
jgi:nucleolar protein 4